MNIDTTWLLFLVLTLFEFVGAIAVCIASLNKRVHEYTVAYRIFMWLTLVGLLGQAFRNIVFLITGVSLPDKVFPIWGFQDIGMAGLAICYAFALTRKKQNTLP
jgi:hypothetical protein